MASKFTNKFRRLTVCMALLLPTINAFAEISLEDSFKAALKNNVTDSIANSRINQMSEEVVQGKSGYLPKLYLKGTYTKQDNLTDIHYANLNLAYSIYKGSRDSLAIDVANQNKELYVVQKDVDYLGLYQNVISAYYNYFLNENDVKNLELLKKQSNDRVQEIQKRVSIGRSRVGELLQAKAQLAQADALLESAKGTAKEYKEKFYVLTGVREQMPAVDLKTNLHEFDFNKILADAFKRPDVKIKELKVDEAHRNVTISKTNHLPTLDLTSNYYLNKRTGTSYSNTDWDVGLTLSFPLFEGFNTDSKISESIEKEHEARFTYLDTKKSVELDLSSKLETHNRYVAQITTYEKALDLSKKSYEEALKDYRLGLITNLDVLTALNLYLDTKRNTEKNTISAIMSEKQLEAAIGIMPKL
jgi:outer membrane protein